MNKDFIPVLIIVIVHFLISLLVLWIVYRIIKKVLLLVKKPLMGTNNSSLTLFISFGITSIFFKDVILDTIIKIGIFFISPLKNLRTLRPNLEFVSSNRDYGEAVLDLFFNWSQIIQESFYDYIILINYTGIIVFITFWILISLFIRETRRNIALGNSENPNKKTGLAATNPAIKNITIISLGFFSIYLIISSIIAVPEFQVIESTHSGSNVISKFEEDLESLKNHDEKYLIINLDSSILKSPHRSFENVNSTVVNTVNEYNEWVRMNWTMDDKVKNNAIKRFRYAVDGKINPRVRVEYSLDLTNWYLSYHDSWFARMSIYKSNLTSLIDDIQRATWKDNFDSDTIYNDKDSSKFKIDLSLNDYTKSRLESYETRVSHILSSMYTINTGRGQIPNKPQIGEKFGIFKSISGWLLKTESLSLAIIVGLFGFGLLGSIGSSYIRRRIKDVRDEDEDEALILSDLKGILINGISAAIVIFLSAKGAIVIFSTGGNDLNPYVLFFGCFMASIFSEDVWLRARKKFRDSLDGAKDKKGIPRVSDNGKDDDADE